MSPVYPVPIRKPPSKTISFRNVKISALISPCLPKYGWIGLEKRGSPRPFKSRLVFHGGLPVWGEICPAKGHYRGRFFLGLKKGLWTGIRGEPVAERGQARRICSKRAKAVGNLHPFSHRKMQIPGTGDSYPFPRQSIINRNENVIPWANKTLALPYRKPI